MRFAVSDLLLLTALVAIYAAGNYLMPAPELSFANLAIGAVTILGMTGPIAYSIHQHRSTCGKRMFACRLRNFWLMHVVVLLIYIAYVAVGVVTGMNGAPLVIAICAGHHLIFLLMLRVVFTEEGFLIGAMFARWSEHRVSFDPRTNRLDFRRLPGVKAPWFWSLQSPGHARLAGDVADEVQAILAEKQSPIEVTTDNTDGHG
ncbi:hypothetical protein Mal64_37000 [Pseudobythopirellula maris]|uniref:Uncharacterized protein n=1 Tax=Pseudobythopirellula maris TaxID=2527991 RepID=A0A5C5ZIA4_9BACT|nr:hypothetical protein [Pseudobythopirellula maris]TWT86870.1 hypothetical protein Mal64_37000 [Pseudobythopirellula maris]